MQPPRKELSDEMKAKLRNEYYGLGGSPNTTMGGNYFLYIILAISILAIMSSALGYL
jgi:L-ascorbate peroxidase